MMTMLLIGLWSSVIPTLPLALPHASLMSVLTNTALLFCAIMLWFERDRVVPGHFGEEERLAA